MLGAIGPTELILILIIFGIFIPAYLWASKKSKKAAVGMPLRWYYFYTYVRLPLSILYGIGLLTSVTTAGMAIICLMIIGFQIANLIGLSKFRLWALNLNIILLFAESIYYSLARNEDGSSDSIGLTTRLIIILLFWFLPNLIYFEKRRKLFSSGGITASAESGLESQEREKDKEGMGESG